MEIKWSNTETAKVLNKLQNKKSAKEIVAEYFWLKEQTVYDDDWENIIDFISDFKDLKALKEKKVQYNDKLESIWITLEMFNWLFSNWLPVKEVELIVEDEREVLEKLHIKYFWKKAWNMKIENLKAKIDEEIKKEISKK